MSWPLFRPPRPTVSAQRASHECGMSMAPAGQKRQASRQEVPSRRRARGASRRRRRCLRNCWMAGAGPSVRMRAMPARSGGVQVLRPRPALLRPGVQRAGAPGVSARLRIALPAQPGGPIGTRRAPGAVSPAAAAKEGDASGFAGAVWRCCTGERADRADASPPGSRPCQPGSRVCPRECPSSRAAAMALPLVRTGLRRHRAQRPAGRAALQGPACASAGPTGCTPRPPGPHPWPRPMRAAHAAGRAGASGADRQEAQAWARHLPTALRRR